MGQARPFLFLFLAAQRLDRHALIAKDAPQHEKTVTSMATWWNFASRLR